MRGLVLLATAATMALVLGDIARHPAVLRDPAAPVYLVSLALVGLAYVVAALLATRQAAALGAAFSVLVGALWVIELWAGNAAAPSLLAAALYRGSIVGVLGATVVAGLMGGLRRGKLADGVSVGVLSGMLSGALVCAIAVMGGAVSQTLGTSDPQTLADFQRSHEADLTTFLVGDWLAAGINHLWIGLFVGSVGGLIGGAVGVAATAGRPAASGS